MKLQTITCMVALLGAGFTASCLAQEWVTTPVENLKTVQGLLQIDQLGEDGYRISVDGHFIAEIGAYSVHISSGLASANSIEYVLLDLSTGGGSCPNLFRILDLTPGRKPYLTGEFGNCSDAPDFSMRSENVMIGFSDAQDYNAKTFIYDTQHRHINSIRNEKAAL